MSIVNSGSLLTLHFRLAGPDGTDWISTFDDRPATLMVGSGELVDAIERRLIGHSEGDTVVVDLEAGIAFGDRRPELVQRVGRRLIAEHLDREQEPAVGDWIRLPAPDRTGSVNPSASAGPPDPGACRGERMMDGGDTISGVVREVGESWCLVDFNHPLAGQPVRFEARLIGVL